MEETKSMTAYAAMSEGVIKKVTVPIPDPDDYEVLVKNEGCVFCNATDRMIVDHLYATPDYPVIFGHESFGKVIKVGKKVTKYKLGDRVICTNAIVNGYNGTYYSSWGGFAEYGIAGDLEAYLADHGQLDEANRYRGRYRANSIIPADFSYEKASLVFPLAETASAAKQVGDMSGKTAVVLGTGIVGCFITYFAKYYGAKEVICLNRSEEKLRIAEKAGADACFTDPEEAAVYIRQRGGADIVFECSGAWQILEKGLPYLKEDGILAVYARPKKPYSFDLLKCPQSFRYQAINPRVPEALEDVCRLLRENKISTEVFLTHTWNFDRVPEAFEEVRSGKVMKGLVVIS